jgi:RNA polymerase sigma-70 factor (ECF subfamily)
VGSKGVASRELEDAELVVRCQSELPYVTESFEMLVRRYEPLVYHACRHYLGRIEEAEEAAQDVLLRVFHGLKRFELRASLRTWIFRIAMNVCATRFKKLRSERERFERVARDRGEGKVSETAPSAPAQGAGAEDMGGPVGAALSRLSEEDRKVLVLRHSLELSLKELAELLELKISTAQMRLYRAQDRFKEVWKGLAGLSRDH